MKPTMEQQRATFAWAAAERGIAAASDKYTKLAKAAPALIMGSGLMQTLAFLSDKGEAQHKQLLQHMLDWLAQRFDGEATLHPQHPFPRRRQEAGLPRENRHHLRGAQVRMEPATEPATILNRAPCDSN